MLVAIIPAMKSLLSLSLTISSLCFFLYLSLLFLPVHFVISNRTLTKKLNKPERMHSNHPLCASFTSSGRRIRRLQFQTLPEGGGIEGKMRFGHKWKTCSSPARSRKFTRYIWLRGFGKFGQQLGLLPPGDFLRQIAGFHMVTSREKMMINISIIEHELHI